MHWVRPAPVGSALRFIVSDGALPQALDLPLDGPYAPSLAVKTLVVALMEKLAGEMRARCASPLADDPNRRCWVEILATLRERFERATWPVPAFHRFDGTSTHVPNLDVAQNFRVEYADDNLITPVRECPATGEDLKLVDDFAFDGTLLAEEVGKRVGDMIPTTDDAAWR